MATKNTTEPEKLKKEIDKSAKLFDVAQPGKTPASATSRPLIVGHGSMVTRDPMVVKEDDDKDEKKQSAKISVRELKLKPDEPANDEPETPSSAEANSTIEPPDTASEKQPPDETVQPDEAPTEQEPTAQPEPKSSQTGVVDSLMNEVDAKQADKKQKQELEIVTAELEKTIEAREFFVPIGLESRRRADNRLAVLLILSLVMGLVGLNFAIDAELVDIGIEALTDVL